LRVAHVVFIAAVLGAVGFALADRWSEVADRLGQVPAGAIVGALACDFAALAASLLAWRTVVADLGTVLSVRGAARIMLVGSLAKYLPGTVWPAVAQMELGRAEGLPRTRAASAFVISALVTIVCGGLVSVLAVPGAVSHSAWWLLVLLALPVLVACLHPRVLNRVLALGLRLARRPPVDQQLTAGGIARASAWTVVAWLCYGVQAAVFVHAVGGGNAATFFLAIGGFALATVVGLLVIPVPAGAGVREVVFIAVVAVSVSSSAVTAAAVLARLTMTLTDVVTGAVAAIPIRRLGTNEVGSDS
jgi:uncharacterized membrane protein YbhN (UPF0104 family)